MQSQVILRGGIVNMLDLPYLMNRGLSKMKYYGLWQYRELNLSGGG